MILVNPPLCTSSDDRMFAKIKPLLIFSLFLLLPTQLGHFFFNNFSFINGIRIDYLAPTIYITDIIVALLLIIELTKKPILITKAVIKFVKKYPIILSIGILILGNIVFATSPLLSIFRWAKMVEMIVVFLIIKNSQNISKKIIFPFLIGSLFQLILVSFQIVNGSSLQGFWYFLGERSFSISSPGISKMALDGVEILRPYGTFSHPNSLAGFYLLVYGYFLYYSKKIILSQILSISRQLLLAISTILVFLTFSKIAISTLIIITTWHVFKQKYKCVLCLTAKLIVPIVIGCLFLSGTGDVDSINKRIWLAKSALQIIISHPLYGTGLGNYLYAQSAFSIPYSYFFLQPVHNIFLLLMAEVGIPLSISFGIVLLRVLKPLFNNRQVVVIVIIIFITGFFDHYWLTLQQNIILIPLVFGLLQKHKSVVK